MKQKDEEWALFWCSLLKPVIFKEIDPKEVNQFLKKLSKQVCAFPNGVGRKPAFSTLKRKLKKYRNGGFKNLERKIRNDRGKSREHRQAIIDRAIELKKDQPFRSDTTINFFLKAEHGQTIPKSTLYRHFKKAGVTKMKLGLSKEKVRKRWTRDNSNDLWVGDFEEGPYVMFNGSAVQTHLSAFIDCYSRLIIEARYYYRQNLDILMDSLLRAWAVHGSSGALYLDNAKVYHSRALKIACYSLNIKLTHRKSGDPAGGGIIESLFSTVQSQFEKEVREGEILTLENLNRAFSAWINMSYHKEIHSEIGQSPAERYTKGLKVIRHVDMEEATGFFMRRELRSVHKDFSDVQLFGRYYRVDKKLRGDRVEVRFDPFSSIESVLIYSLEGEYLGKGILHNREKGEEAIISPRGKPQYSYLDLLIEEHEKELKAKTQGIDYRKAIAKRKWPFSAFANDFAKLMGRKGKLSSFNTEELEQLQNFYNKTPGLNKTILVEAFENAQVKTIPCVAYKIQKLISKKQS